MWQDGFSRVLRFAFSLAVMPSFHALQAPRWGSVAMVVNRLFPVLRTLPVLLHRGID
jgi:hypothetical protein